MSSISKSCGLSSSLQEEVMVIKKQGIVSIVGFSHSSSSQNTKSRSSSAAVSLRRTLSADMSSKTWLSQNGFSSLKRIASSEEFPVYEEEEEEEEEGRGQLEIWESIQQNNKIEKDKKNIDRQFDIWSSMLSNKQDNNNNDDNNNNVPPPPPYVHPLVKKASSSLSGKSLQICTESLGSETGSDGFSSSENGDEHADGDQQEQELVVEEEEGVKRSEKFGEVEEEDILVEKYNNLAASAAGSATKKSTTRSFPPPLPSLSRGGDGASLHMRPHRDNGRLVLEAVSVPSQNNFHAERQDGRLVLTFINNNEGEIIKTTSSEEEKNDVGLFPAEIHGGEQDEDRTELEAEPAAEVVRLTVPKTGGGGVMNVHRLALMMNKSAVLSNRIPTWSNKFNNDEDQEIVNPITPVTQSLPPRPPVARMISMTPAAAAVATATAAARGTGGAGSLNAYEYYWKTKPIASTKAELISPLGQNQTITKNIIMGNHEKQELLVLRGNKGDNYLLPLSSKGCKEQRRSLLFWEPYCIATS